MSEPSRNITGMSACKAVDWITGRLDYAWSEELCAVLRRIEAEWDEAEAEARALERAHNAMPDAAERQWERAGCYEDAHEHVRKARALIEDALKHLDCALDFLTRGES